MQLKKYYFLISIIFLFLIFCFNFRFEILLNIFSTLGYEENKSKRLSFIISEKPYQYISQKLRVKFSNNSDNFLNYNLKLKLDFIENKDLKSKFDNGNYYLNIFDLPEINNITSVQKIDYSNIWQNKIPQKIWKINMSNNSFNEINNFRIVQAAPKICGNKLIYARPDGNFGAVDYRTGKRFWHKKIDNISSLSMRGFNCKYDEELNTYVILLPTGSGIFCINANDGSLITSRCDDGRLGVFESRISPKLVNGVVYSATVNPAGIEAHNFFDGKLLWRTEFTTGSAFLDHGSNPWSGFEIDEKNSLLFVNTGSPAGWSRFMDNPDKYRYSDSLIALNLYNGKIIWQFQENSKDTLNHDLVGKPILSPRKIKDKDIVITFSKSGSIYFIDRKNGLPVFPIKEAILEFGGIKYSQKQSINPGSLLDLNYFNFLGRDCVKCSLNTKIFGPFPPIIKITRVSDGYNGGLQWPGATIDNINNLLILSSNHNLVLEAYFDYVPKPLSFFSDIQPMRKCTSCHDSKGAVNIKEKEKLIIPSLFLTSKIYDFKGLSNYLENNNFHKNLKLDQQVLNVIYKALEEYDLKLIKNNKYQYYQLLDLKKTKMVDKETYDFYLKGGPMGKISAISLDTGKIIWQVPAGTYLPQNSKIIFGSPNYGGITYGNSNSGISFFTGSYDKKIYAIDNKNGKYLWSANLPASGSALPLVYNTSFERWIFVVATGGRFPNDRSDSVIAFRQKLN